MQVRPQHTTDLGLKPQAPLDWWTTPQCSNGFWLQKNVSLASRRDLVSSEATPGRGDIASDCRPEHNVPGTNSPVELEAIPVGGNSPLIDLKISSDTPIIERGRPTKRFEGVIKRHPSESVQTDPSMDTKTIAELPTGIGVAKAPYRLSRSQIINLREEAVKQAKHFEVLQCKDVEALSKVLVSRTPTRRACH